MSRFGLIVREFLTPVLVVILGGVVAYDHLAPRPAAVAVTSVDGKSLGRKFAVALATSYGDAWTQAANLLEQGKPVSEAQSAMQVQWQQGRARAFGAQVSPEFSKVLGEGAEPTDPAKRAEVVKLWRDFSTGLKGGR